MVRASNQIAVRSRGSRLCPRPLPAALSPEDRIWRKSQRRDGGHQGTKRTAQQKTSLTPASCSSRRRNKSPVKFLKEISTQRDKHEPDHPENGFLVCHTIPKDLHDATVLLPSKLRLRP